MEPIMKASRPGWQPKAGQIVIEYMLLLVLAAAIAVTISSTLTSRNPSSPGFLMLKWQQIIEFIGQDQADDISR